MSAGERYIRDGGNPIHGAQRRKIIPTAQKIAVGMAYFAWWFHLTIFEQCYPAQVRSLSEVFPDRR